MNKESKYQAIGITLVSILVISSIAYVATLQQPTPVTPITYDVRNFDSYHALTSFLQTGNQQNTMSTATNGAFAPTAERVQSSVSDLMVDGKSAQGGQSIDYSKTNVQVQGVDEPDIVKTDGTYLYIVSNNKVLIVKAYPAEEAVLEATITLDANLSVQNIFISGTRLVIFAQSYNNVPILYDTGIVSGDVLLKESSIQPWYSSPDTYIKVYSVETPSSPQLVKDTVVGGYFAHARLIGDYIYVITTQYTYSSTDNQNTTIVPRVSVDGQAIDIPLSDIYYVNTPEKSNTITNVVSINIQDDAEQIHAKVFLLGSSQNVYVSESDIYITYTTWMYYDYTQLQKLVDDVLMPILPETVKAQLSSVAALDLQDYQKQEISFWILQNYAQNSMPEAQKNQIIKDIVRNTEQTIIHRISIDNGSIVYEAQGTVPGYINDQFSLDEYNGYLHVATTLQGSSISYIFGSIDPETNIYVLDSQMQTVGSLEDITPGTGESIFATRFIGNTCYMVTFKQTDPFMVIDLSTPTAPTLLGQLEIPGYSTYLHPYDDTHVIGIGRNGSGVKISLYDITDISHPIEDSTYVISNQDQSSYWWTESAALYEHKAFLFDKEKQLLVIPAGNYSQQNAYVFSISLENGLALKGVITHDFPTDQTPNYYWGTSANSIERTLFIDNVLYTISQNGVKMNSLEDLSEIHSMILS
jgi:inhibitor of cysteine peptidase